MDDVRFAFQPLVNLQTGAVMALELLARPLEGDVAGLFAAAARAGRLEQFDVALAVSAVAHAARYETLLPVHLNLLADTVSAEPEVLAPLHEALHRAGRPASEAVLDINPPLGALDPQRLHEGLAHLRRRGHRLALDGVGAGDLPLTVIAGCGAEQLKVDREIVAGLPDDERCTAVLVAIAGLAARTGATLVAEGVETDEQLGALRSHGVAVAQGNLLGPPSRRPATTAPIPLGRRDAVPALAPAGIAATERLREFAHPPVTLPVTVTSGEVRDALAGHPERTGVVLIDEDGMPSHSLDRNRFLLAVSGAYGHALHHRRDAALLADPPRTLPADSAPRAALDLIGSGDPQRMYDDIVLLEPDGRCAGVVRIGDVVRGVAERATEVAAALHPLTGLPGSDALAGWIDDRVARGEIFAVSWLDVDDFGTVNDAGGFAAGDDLIRDLGRGLAEAATTVDTARVAHVGGNDFVSVTDLDDVVPFGSAVLDVGWHSDGTEVALTMASLVCAPGTVTGHRDVSRLLAQLRRRAKQMPGTSWVFGRPGSNHIDVVRGGPAGIPDTAQRRIS